MNFFQKINLAIHQGGRRRQVDPTPGPASVAPTQAPSPAPAEKIERDVTPELKDLTPHTQKAEIIQWLLMGNSITALEAMDCHHPAQLRCMNLKGRISELRADGWPIADEWEINKTLDKRYKRYYLTSTAK